jgi:general stress protein 26
MSTTKDLMRNDAVDKLRELVENTPTCMMGTGLRVIPSHICPMQVQEVDELGNLWFFSGADSVHNQQISGDQRTQLTFCNSSKIEYLVVFGDASISRERRRIDELWTKMAEAWFPKGKDDPKLTLICVKPTSAHYWDTEDGKMVAFAKILVAAVTGKPNDSGGVDGDIKV